MSLQNHKTVLIPVDPSSSAILPLGQAVTMESDVVYLGGNGNVSTGITDPLLAMKIVKVYRDKIKGRFFAYVYDGTSDVLLNNTSLPCGVRRKLSLGDVLSMQNGEGVQYKFRFEKSPPTNETVAVAVGQKGSQKSSPPSKFSENITCAICLDILFSPKTMVPCGHSFCKECIAEQTKCPECMKDIESQVTCYPLQTLVELMVDGSAAATSAVAVQIDKDNVDQYQKRKREAARARASSCGGAARKSTK